LAANLHIAIHAYHNSRWNGTNDYELKSCNFEDVDDLWITGRIEQENRLPIFQACSTSGIAVYTYPVPGEDAFHRNDNILTIGNNSFEKGITIGFHGAMFPVFTFFIEDADIHFSCV